MHHVKIYFFGLIVSICVTSCTFFNTTQDENRKARCQVLNRQMIFNGASASPGIAAQQRAQMDTLSKNYREDKCDGPT